MSGVQQVSTPPPPGYPYRDIDEGKLQDNGGGEKEGKRFANLQAGLMRNATISEEDQLAREMKFDDKIVRRGFIRKVFSILNLQLLVSVSAITFFIFWIPSNFEGGAYGFLNRYYWLMWTSMGVSLLVLFPMICIRKLRRSFPINFILLATFTAAESILLGMVSLVYETDAVMMAAGITAVVVFALTVFAFQTKWDFTMCGGMIVCVLMVFFVFGIVMIFLPADRYLHMVYGALGALIFSLYLVYDTQMMMGGDHKFSISPEEYIFAHSTCTLPGRY